MEYRRNTRQGQQDTEDLLTIRLPPQPSLVLALFHRLCVCDMMDYLVQTVFAVFSYFCVIILYFCVLYKTVIIIILVNLKSPSELHAVLANETS